MSDLQIKRYPITGLTNCNQRYMLRMTIKLARYKCRYKVEKKGPNNYTITWSKTMSTLKMFQFKGGETDWVIANTLEEAKTLLKDELDYDDESFGGVEVKEIPYNELINYNLVTEEEDSEKTLTTFKHRFDEFVSNKEIAPSLIASTMFL